MGDESIDVRVHNVVSAFSTRCHLDLRTFALHSANITYERGKGVAVKQMRNPKCQARIWSSGKASIIGCKSEEDARRVSRALARQLQKWIPKVKFANYRVTNILATCRLPWGVDLIKMATEHPKQASYEPELNTGLIWRTTEPKATLRIHTTGSITVTGANSVANVQSALEIIYPIVSPYQVKPVVPSALDVQQPRMERNYPGPTPNSSRTFANWTNTAPYQFHRVSQPSAHNHLSSPMGPANGRRMVTASISQSVLIAKRNAPNPPLVELDSDSEEGEFEDF